MTIIEHADMSKYTSFRAGGTAKKLVIVDSRDELKDLLSEIKAKGEDFIFLGNGSNTLFLDGEYSGTVIKAQGEFEKIETRKLSDDLFEVSAGSAALLSKVSKIAAAESLTGLEFAAGIPGSVGGGVFMNAGAYDGEIKKVLKKVILLSPNENEYYVKEADVNDLDLGYRHSLIMTSGEIILEAVFLLKKGIKEEIESLMRELAERRNSKQPLEYPSAGSFFKRPEGNFAGKLIQDAGLAGLTVGGAQVSEKHCGFVINRGDATASDIVDLMRIVQNAVMDKFNIKLEPEVRIIGEV